MSKSKEKVKMNEIFDWFPTFLIKFDYFHLISNFFLIKLELWDWNLICFNRFCCHEQIPTFKFVSKIWLKSDLINKFFKILSQVVSITLTYHLVNILISTLTGSNQLNFFKGSHPCGVHLILSIFVIITYISIY